VQLCNDRAANDNVCTPLAANADCKCHTNCCACNSSVFFISTFAWLLLWNITACVNERVLWIGWCVCCCCVVVRGSVVKHPHIPTVMKRRLLCRWPLQLQSEWSLMWQIFEEPISRWQLTVCRAGLPYISSIIFVISIWELSMVDSFGSWIMGAVGECDVLG